MVVVSGVSMAVEKADYLVPSKVEQKAATTVALMVALKGLR